MTREKSTHLALSIRLDLPGGQRFGPGKATLLTAIESHGSITAAAQVMAMSYPRALKLIETMNMQFRDPLIETFHGGATKGGAKLTETGHTVLRLYYDLLAATDAATQSYKSAFLDLAQGSEE